MNLIEDAWIPARRRSGKVERITPWQLTDRFDEDPFVGLAAPRPDFNGALIQFLIGLLQTHLAPEKPRPWRLQLRTPPTPSELQAAFFAARDAFEMSGDGPRFLQDLTLEDEILPLSPAARAQRTKSIGDLLIDLPTGKTLRDNTDHFIKRGMIESLCTACAATALFVLQTNAPSGGQGHRTGIRGGGPLTTLIRGDTLWGTCWLNVLSTGEFIGESDDDFPGSAQDRYPWLRATRTSEGGRGTTPEDVHPTQVFWAMPRRIRLLFVDEDAVCDLCHGTFHRVVRQYETKNLGVNYTGPWRHPLSPHFVDGDGVPSPLHPQPGGISYRHWLGLVQSTSDGNGTKAPAAVVERYLRADLGDLRLWAFGYDMDNMKARCWHDSTMPLLQCPETIRDTFEYQVRALVRGADLAAFETRKHVRKALFKPGNDVKGDLSFVSSRFWQETEPAFFATLPRLREGLEDGADVLPEMEAWHRVLSRTAEGIFDDLSQTGAFDAADPKRIALAWRDLRKTLQGKKMRETLGLPIPVRKRAAARKRKEG
jgi:CRISPR system Cascade subunit CasA